MCYLFDVLYFGYLLFLCLLDLLAKTPSLTDVPFEWHTMTTVAYEKKVTAKKDIKKFDLIHMIQVSTLCGTRPWPNHTHHLDTPKSPSAGSTDHRDTLLISVCSEDGRSFLTCQVSLWVCLVMAGLSCGHWWPNAHRGAAPHRVVPSSRIRSIYFY